MHQQLLSFAESFGVEGMKPPKRIQNTRRVLAVSELAREKGVLEEFRAVAMNAHWRESANLEDLDVLAALGEQAGLDPAEVREAADDERQGHRVDELIAEARQQGVSGIPTFFFGEARITGCQPYDHLAQAAEEAGAKRRSRA